MGDKTFNISIEEYSELLAIKERLNCITKIIADEGYAGVDTIMLIAETKYSDRYFDKKKMEGEKNEY